jgi:hypothetical protein
MTRYYPDTEAQQKCFPVTKPTMSGYCLICEKRLMGIPLGADLKLYGGKHHGWHAICIPCTNELLVHLGLKDTAPVEQFKGKPHDQGTL